MDKLVNEKPSDTGRRGVYIHASNIKRKNDLYIHKYVKKY